MCNYIGHITFAILNFQNLSINSVILKKVSYIMEKYLLKLNVFVNGILGYFNSINFRYILKLPLFNLFFILQQ